jgi:hypothetical protein
MAYYKAIDVWLTFGSTIITVLNEVKDLKVVFSNGLTFTSHNNCMIAKASIRANLTHKGIILKDVTIESLSYVRPLVEYASYVWLLIRNTAVCDIESVQHKFTKTAQTFKL